MERPLTPGGVQGSVWPPLTQVEGIEDQEQRVCGAGEYQLLEAVTEVVVGPHG